MTTLIISNDEIHDIIKIVESLEDSSLLGKLLAGKGLYRAGKGKGAGYGNKMIF